MSEVSFWLGEERLRRKLNRESLKDRKVRLRNNSYFFEAFAVFAVQISSRSLFPSPIPTSPSGRLPEATRSMGGGSLAAIGKSQRCHSKKSK
jgi:hypothetical protein